MIHLTVKVDGVPLIERKLIFFFRYVTIIRSPVDNVESVFGFFQDQDPFEQWMGGINTTLRLGEFYADPTKYYNRDTDWYFRSKNHMFFDIGWVAVNVALLVEFEK